MWRFFIVDWIEMGKEKMTLRDQFARSAMNGLLSADVDDGWTADNVASFAYKVADAMLKAREIDNANPLPESQQS